MIRKCLSYSLAIILIQISAVSALSATKVEQDAKRLAHVKAEVARRGGGKAITTITMIDGKKLKGVIEDAGTDSFALRESETCALLAVSYTHVAKIAGKEWSLSQKVLFGFGVLIVVSVALFPNGKD